MQAFGGEVGGQDGDTEFAGFDVANSPAATRWQTKNSNG